jgi:hypothetical protein
MDTKGTELVEKERMIYPPGLLPENVEQELMDPSKH